MLKVTNMPKQTEKDLEEYVRKFEACRKELGKIGFILTGSITKHYTKCRSPSCRCMKDPDYRHGPYYDWTRKVKGKTVTIRLSKEEADILKEWADNKKQFYEIIKRMEMITLDAVREIRV